VGPEKPLMFGMLDYRAHQLYWLLTLPFAVVAKLSFYAVVVASIVIAEQTSKSVGVKVVIAYLAMEAICLLVFQGFWRLVFGAVNKVFFFFVDVLPAHGTNAEEAKAVVLLGNLFLLNKKFDNEIEHSTEEDTRSYLSLVGNWRARAFFNARERFGHVIEELKRIHQETGQEPRDLGCSGVEKVRESLKGGHVTLLEKVIVPQHLFNSLVGLIIIIFAVCYIGRDLAGGF
jgi:hypothetical protein